MSRQGKKRKLRRLKLKEAQGVGNAIGILYQRFPQVSQSYDRMTALTAVSGVELPPGYISRSEWQMLMVARLAPLFDIKTPRIRESTKRHLLSMTLAGELRKSVEAYETLEVAEPVETPRKVKKQTVKSPPMIKDPDLISRFYKSYDWRRARYEVIQKYDRKCMVCNRADLVLHVDHIKPLRKYWNLRLDLNNLQVLCELCNHGKGNWDETDWRPKEETIITSTLKIERVRLPSGLWKRVD